MTEEEGQIMFGAILVLTVLYFIVLLIKGVKWFIYKDRGWESDFFAEYFLLEGWTVIVTIPMTVLYAILMIIWMGDIVADYIFR